MKSLIQYIYYRLTKFYKNTFGIEDSPGFLIQSCYDWGSQILTSIVCFYILAIETIILQFLGIRMKTSFILITMLPFIFLHIFFEDVFGDEKKLFAELDKKFKGDKYPIIKGVIIAIFAILSLVSFIMALRFCK